jgi:hypothetical protein
MTAASYCVTTRKNRGPGGKVQKVPIVEPPSTSLDRDPVKAAQEFTAQTGNLAFLFDGFVFTISFGATFDGDGSPCPAMLGGERQNGSLLLKSV